MADNESRAGVSHATADVMAFVNQLHAPHDEALLLAFEAPERHDMPAIQVGPSEGKLLGLLLKLVSARRVVEIGTLAGYSAIRMGRALPDDGEIYTVEFDERHAAVARANIQAAGLSDRIRVLEGKALDVLPLLVRFGPFDAIFIDADKGNYDKYGRWAAAHVRPGGLLIADNAFFFGRLLEESPEAAAMRRFHEESRIAFDTVCLATPDGLLLGIRK